MGQESLKITRYITETFNTMFVMFVKAYMYLGCFKSKHIYNADESVVFSLLVP